MIRNVFWLFMDVTTQVILVGGLFPQFVLNSNGEYAVDQAGARELAAVQMAINRVNNKHDGMYDELLPNTKVRG